MRKPLTTSINEEMLKTLKHMSVDLNCGVNDIIEAALVRLFEEYNRPIPKNLSKKAQEL